MFSSPPRDEVLRRNLMQIVYHAATNPDRGSEFDIATRDIRALEPAQFIAALAHRGYDCIVAEQNGTFAGLVGFQTHPDGSWHSFAYNVPMLLQGQGIGKLLIATFIKAAYYAGVSDMRIYGGNIRRELSDKNDKTMRHMYEDLVLKGRLGLPFPVSVGADIGWVKLEHPHSSNA